MPFLVEVFPHFNKIGSALDIGCGGGRDAVFLAEQGWQVTAADNQSAVLACAESLADQVGVKVNWCLCDIEDVDHFPTGPFDLILMSRFLDRRLFPVIKRSLSTGGLLLVHTFSEGCQRYGSPKNPKYILQPGELSKEFNSFQIIIDRILLLPDGRPMNAFLARKLENSIDNEKESI
jgi:SAM-dependent methyltransferase